MTDLFGKTPEEKKNEKTKRKMKDKKVKEKYPEPESFENAIAKLEDVLRTLESGQIGLEESLSKYSEAQFLGRWCLAKLSSIQGELKKLGLDEDSNFSLEDFPPLE
ncbi:exodeoxyribonuclease VII small subunit [bacterium]|nr:exodeoxyribonuclease VII small subunit [bacterium]